VHTVGSYCTDMSVFVALVIQHAKRMRHIVIYGMPGCKVFFHIIS